MPKWASRWTLTVGEVAVIRAREISNEDATETGCPGWYSPCHPDMGTTDGRIPLEEFRDQFDTDHPGAWERNDWCVSAAVETVKGNCDE
jgi:hypothetical protein